MIMSTSKSYSEFCKTHGLITKEDIQTKAENAYKHLINNNNHEEVHIELTDTLIEYRILLTYSMNN